MCGAKLAAFPFGLPRRLLLLFTSRQFRLAKQKGKTMPIFDWVLLTNAAVQMLATMLKLVALARRRHKGSRIRR
jgi:hypothetical protein